MERAFITGLMAVFMTANGSRTICTAKDSIPGKTVANTKASISMTRNKGSAFTPGLTADNT